MTGSRQSIDAYVANTKAAASAAEVSDLPALLAAVAEHDRLLDALARAESLDAASAGSLLTAHRELEQRVGQLRDDTARELGELRATRAKLAARERVTHVPVLASMRA